MKINEWFDQYNRLKKYFNDKNKRLLLLLYYLYCYLLFIYINIIITPLLNIMSSLKFISHIYANHM